MLRPIALALALLFSASHVAKAQSVTVAYSNYDVTYYGNWEISSDATNIQTNDADAYFTFLWTDSVASTLHYYGGGSTAGGDLTISVGNSNYQCNGYLSSEPSGEAKLSELCSVSVPAGSNAIQVTNSAAGTVLIFEQIIFTNGSKKNTIKNIIIGAVVGGLVLIAAIVTAISRRCRRTPGRVPVVPGYEVAQVSNYVNNMAYQNAGASFAQQVSTPIKDQTTFLAPGLPPNAYQQQMNYQGNNFQGNNFQSRV